MAITRDEVLRVAGLARLRLEPEEADRLAGELAHILHAFERLQTLDLTGVDPMACVDDFGAVLRRDEITNPAADDDLPLRNAPAHDGRHFRVPKIIE